MKYATYATTDECYPKFGRYDIPEIWWSRRFEYPWAAEFVNVGEKVMDAGCGIDHPFKNHLADVSGNCWGVDSDKRLNSLESYPGLSRVICDLNSISIGSGTFDKVFCISVLEHLGAMAIPKVLDEFYKALRPGGQAIISFDIPDISVRLWKTIVDASKLQFHPEIKPTDFDEPENVLTSPRKFRGKFLKCFCNVLVKPE